MKILHLVYSGQRRGAETFAWQLSRGMADAEVSQAFSSVYGFSDELLQGEFPLFPLRAERQGLGKLLRFDPRAVTRLVRLGRQYRPDFILAHGADTLKYAALARPFLPASVRVVYRNIGFASHWVGSTTKARLSSLLLRQVDAVISVGQASARDFVQTYRFPRARTVAIPNGVDAQPFLEMDRSATRNQVRRALELREDGPVAIFVGNLSEEKNPQHCIQIAARLKNLGVLCQLLFVGDGPLQDDLQRECDALGLADQTRFLGSRSDVPTLLSAADLLLLPSRTEGMPAVVIEAGLAGVPAVAYQVGDMAEVIEPETTGLLAQPGNLEEFTQAVALVWQDPEKRRAMGEAARQRYAQKFDVRRVAARYRETLSRLQDDPKNLSLTASDAGL